MENTLDPPSLTVLIVESDDVVYRQVEHILHDYIPGSELRRARGINAVLLVLEQEDVDAIVTSESIEEGTLEDLLVSLRSKYPTTAVVACLQENNHSYDDLILADGTVDVVRIDSERQYLYSIPASVLNVLRQQLKLEIERETFRLSEQRDLLKVIRGSLSRVYHEINNPLSIISGNAQLLIELGRAMEVGDELIQPMRDIEEASRRISSLLQEISKIKTMIPYASNESFKSSLRS